jgi:hypothetical protein
MDKNKTSAEVADEKISELRGVIREANQVLGDLRRERKEAQALFKELIPGKVEDVLNQEVKEGLENFTKAVQTANEQAVQRVFKQFENLSNDLMYGSKADRRKGEFSIPDVVKARVEGEAPPNT